MRVNAAVKEEGFRFHFGLPDEAFDFLVGKICLDSGLDLTGGDEPNVENELTNIRDVEGFLARNGDALAFGLPVNGIGVIDINGLLGVCGNLYLLREAPVAIVEKPFLYGLGLVTDIVGVVVVPVVVVVVGVKVVGFPLTSNFISIGVRNLGNLKIIKSKCFRVWGYEVPSVIC
jgi:hypothetical protein